MTGFVANFLADFERLLKIAKGGIVVALRAVDVGDIIESGAFAGLVTDFLPNLEGLLKEVEGSFVVALL